GRSSIGVVRILPPATREVRFGFRAGSRPRTPCRRRPRVVGPSSTFAGSPPAPAAAAVRNRKNLGRRAMSDQNKEIARTVYDAFNSGNLDSLDDVIGSDAIDHDPQNPFGGTHGPEGAKQAISMYRSAFPDLKIKVEAQIAEGNLVVTRWTSTGTHDGDL